MAPPGFAAADKGDFVSVAAAYSFFIGQGKPGTEKTMAAAHRLEVVGTSNLNSWGAANIHYWK